MQCFPSFIFFTLLMIKHYILNHKDIIVNYHSLISHYSVTLNSPERLLSETIQQAIHSYKIWTIKKSNKPISMTTCFIVECCLSLHGIRI